MTGRQLGLFDEGESSPFPITIGHAQVDEVAAKSILTKASGFMSGYDFTLNPYGGCSFGCSYCYAAFFSRDLLLQQTWGQWVHAKTNAIEAINRMRTNLRGKSVYMSSVTDPYQPIERRLGLVREILLLLSARGVRIVIQTRSPLVLRDVDLLATFDVARVNITVTTDSDSVQRAFEPHCPTNRRRLDAAQKLVEAGVDTRITMTPLLPVDDVASFANQLRATGVEHFVIQPFHATRGRFVAGTGQEARAITERMRWTADKYDAAATALRAALPNVLVGQAGFAPP